MVEKVEKIDNCLMVTGLHRLLVIKITKDSIVHPRANV